MLQHITPEMLNELTDEQKERLREWWRPQVGDRYYYPAINNSWIIASGDKNDQANTKKHVYPLLSIGQCIELLGDKQEKHRLTIGKNNYKLEHFALTEDMAYYGEENNPKFWAWLTYVKNKELIHALWQAVKAVL